ncbi:MAG: hypothetical protein ACI88C_003349 [Acidimicrobiales bacterium]|jgi:hypothetical protein
MMGIGHPLISALRLRSEKPIVDIASRLVHHAEPDTIAATANIARP